MMTSVGIERARDTRDKALPTTTQTTQPQKQLQVGEQQHIETHAMLGITYYHALTVSAVYSMTILCWNVSQNAIC